MEESITLILELTAPDELEQCRGQRRAGKGDGTFPRGRKEFIEDVIVEE